MQLLPILIALVVIGVGVYLLSLIPMDARIKQAIYVVAILFAVIFILQRLGFNTGLPPVTFGLPLLFFGGLRSVATPNGPGTPTHVPIVIPIAADDATSPPKTPWQAALARALAGIAVVAPIVLMFIIDPLVEYLSRQTVVLPDAYKQWQPVIGIVLSGAVLSYQAIRKQQKESGRQTASREMGLTDSQNRPTVRARNAVRAATGPGG